MAHRIFPRADILAIEPQREKQSQLEKLSQTHENIRNVGVLLGPASDETVDFHLNESVSSVLPEHESDAPTQERRSLTTLDLLVEGSVFAQPDLLKVDVQGYELEVLRGAEQTLSAHPPELILMEVSLLEINEGAPLLAEVVAFMDERSYQMYDICSFMRRPYDDALWQIDALFAHSSSKLVSSKRWD
jgi:FkbM family methyltransferase